MSRKFDQYCPVAHALSLVGERWSLLIVRELLHGPKRYTDLTNGLPGIGTNILAARLREEWGVNAFRALFDPQAARGLTETYVLRIDDDVFTARLVNGSLEASVGAADDADVVVELDMETLFALTGGELEPREAVESGRARVEGDVEALERCFRVLTLAPRIDAAV